MRQRSCYPLCVRVFSQWGIPFRFQISQWRDGLFFPDQSQSKCACKIAHKMPSLFLFFFSKREYFFPLVFVQNARSVHSRRNVGGEVAIIDLIPSILFSPSSGLPWELERIHSQEGFWHFLWWSRG